MAPSRRSFLKFAAALPSWWMLGRPRPGFGLDPEELEPDLVGVKDGSPAQMFDLGIKALGAMDRFVKPGQTVLVKPNIGWNKSPTEGANTNPDLVGKIVQAARMAGAAEVCVFDHTCNKMDDCYRNSGIAAAVKANGGRMYPGESQKHYRPIKIPGAVLLKEVLVHELFLDCDVVINAPILKHHVSTTMTAAIKNLMGVVWDRGYWHKAGLHQCLADFALLRKIDLTVIDAYTVMTRNGPRGLSAADLELRRLQILSTDMLLADAAAAKVLNQSAAEVAYLALSEQLGVGSLNLSAAKIKRLSCQSGPV